MDTDYSFFEMSLGEIRTYRVTTGWHCDRFVMDNAWRWHTGKLDVRPYIQLLDGGKDSNECTIRGSHVMRPGDSAGVSAINEEFGITLAQDIDEFYRRWDGGFLLFQEFYELFSVQEIIEEAFAQAELQARPPELPWKLLRFCIVGEDYLAWSLRGKSTWEVLYVESGTFDAELIEDTEDTEWRVIDSSFSSWLGRMCKTDGWPIGGEAVMDQDEEPPAVRIKGVK